MMFFQKIETRWASVAKHYDQYLNSYFSWLEEKITFSNDLFEAIPGTPKEIILPNKPRRPQQDFSDYGPESKLQK